MEDIINAAEYHSILKIWDSKTDWARLQTFKLERQDRTVCEAC